MLGGLTPQEFAPLFERLGVSAEIWRRLVKDFGKLFSLVAGRRQRIDSHSSKAAKQLIASGFVERLGN